MHQNFRTSVLKWVERGGRKGENDNREMAPIREENHSYQLKTFDSCILKLSVGPPPQMIAWGWGSGVRHAPLSNVKIQE